MGMYKSPIEIIQGQLKMDMENGILRAVQQQDIVVDKHELLRALQYDRGQYEKGYKDAVRERSLVEVVHAQWDEWWPGDCALIMTGEEMLYQCSACTAKYDNVEGFRYCPHCGAKMDGDGNA